MHNLVVRVPKKCVNWGDREIDLDADKTEFVNAMNVALDHHLPAVVFGDHIGMLLKHNPHAVCQPEWVVIGNIIVVPRGRSKFGYKAMLEVESLMIKEQEPKPAGEILKLKMFMDVFNGLSGPDRDDVELKVFTNQLRGTGKFTEDDAQIFIKKAMQKGQLYERKPGWFQTA